MKTYTVIINKHSLVTLQVRAVNAGEALLYAEALLKDGISIQVDTTAKKEGR